jgi:hypothetical protein
MFKVLTQITAVLALLDIRAIATQPTMTKMFKAELTHLMEVQDTLRHTAPMKLTTCSRELCRETCREFSHPLIAQEARNLKKKTTKELFRTDTLQFMVDQEQVTRRHATKATRNPHELFMAQRDHKDH